jgi:hypothetical protein
LHCQVFQIFWPQFAIRVLVVFPLGVGFAVTMTWIIVPMFFVLAWGMKFVLAFFLLTSLWAAGARRLQDTGEARKDIFIPAGVFFGPPIGLAAGLVNAIFLNSFIGFLLLIFLFVLMIYFSFFAAFAFPGPTIGQPVVTSERGYNRFGPAPNEYR